jgi:nicotinamidase-related amidase
MNDASGKPPIRARDRGLSRERAVEPTRTALLVIDVQNGTFNEAEQTIRPEFYGNARDVVIPNLVKIIAACRASGIEVIYTVIENLTRDGRDRSLDYKLSDFFFAKGSWEGRVIAAIAPGEDEIVLPKTSSSVFNSTNIDYLLRNIGIEDLVIAGFLTDQCIDHTVKDAADRGYYVTCLTDACMANTAARHEAALACFAGYCRQMTSEAWLELVRAGAVQGR